MRPTAHSLSFASPKESKQRKGEPDSSPGCAGTLRCSPRSGCAETRFAQTPAPLIRPRLRYSPPHNGVGGRKYQQPNRQRRALARPSARAPEFGIGIGVCLCLCPPPPFKAGLSSAGKRGSGRALFEAIAEFSPTPLLPSSARNRAAAMSWARLSLLTLFGEAKKVSAQSGANPTYSASKLQTN